MFNLRKLQYTSRPYSGLTDIYNSGSSYYSPTNLARVEVMVYRYNESSLSEAIAATGSVRIVFEVEFAQKIPAGEYTPVSLEELKSRSEKNLEEVKSERIREFMMSLLANDLLEMIKRVRKAGEDSLMEELISIGKEGATREQCAARAIPFLRSLANLIWYAQVVGWKQAVIEYSEGKCFKVQEIEEKVEEIIFVVSGSIVAGIFGALSLSNHQLTSGGMQLIPGWITQPASLTWLFWLFAWRFFATLLCFCSGIPGGVFAPSLALGTLCGALAGNISHLLFPEIDIAYGVFPIIRMAILLFIKIDGLYLL